MKFQNVTTFLLLHKSIVEILYIALKTGNKLSFFYILGTLFPDIDCQPLLDWWPRASDTPYKSLLPVFHVN